MFALFQEAHPLGIRAAHAESARRTRWSLMIDMIIPATDTPGAKGARVNEFIDVILTEWATPEERRNFLDGLAGVDKQSNRYTARISLTLRPSSNWFSSAPSTMRLTRQRVVRRAHGNTVPKPDTQLEGNFWEVFKRITVHGYYTSEIGFTQELKLKLFPAHSTAAILGAGTGNA